MLNLLHHIFKIKKKLKNVIITAVTEIKNLVSGRIFALFVVLHAL